MLIWLEWCLRCLIERTSRVCSLIFEVFVLILFWKYPGHILSNWKDVYFPLAPRQCQSSGWFLLRSHYCQPKQMQYRNTLSGLQGRHTVACGVEQTNIAILTVLITQCQPFCGDKRGTGKIGKVSHIRWIHIKMLQISPLPQLSAVSWCIVFVIHVRAKLQKLP